MRPQCLAFFKHSNSFCPYGPHRRYLCIVSYFFGVKSKVTKYGVVNMFTIFLCDGTIFAKPQLIIVPGTLCLTYPVYVSITVISMSQSTLSAFVRYSKQWGCDVSHSIKICNEFIFHILCNQTIYIKLRFPIIVLGICSSSSDKMSH